MLRYSSERKICHEPQDLLDRADCDPDHFPPSPMAENAMDAQPPIIKLLVIKREELLFSNFGEFIENILLETSKCQISSKQQSKQCIEN